MYLHNNMNESGVVTSHLNSGKNARTIDFARAKYLFRIQRFRGIWGKQWRL